MLATAFPPLLSDPAAQEKTRLSHDDEDECALADSSSSLTAKQPALKEEAAQTVENASSDEDEVIVPLQAHPEKLRNGIRHVDSLVSFVKHCQQQHEESTQRAFKLSSPTTSAVLATEDLEEEVQLKVSFSANKPVVHHIPSVPSTDFGKIWMTVVDFERQEKEVRMTCFRWENHLRGEIPFDETNNSIRGLEHLYRETKDHEGKHNPSSKRLHRNAVLNEIRRQRNENHGRPMDTERIREVSIEASRSDLEKCLALGHADHRAALRAWQKPVAPATPPKPSDRPDKKKGKGLRFWKKK